MTESTTAPDYSNVINFPAHYIHGRKIQPIDVIEGYGLCHHLACAVKYISRAGRKHSAIIDIRKAFWYVERELQGYSSGNVCNTGNSVGGYSPLPENKIGDILEDWKLPFNLSEALGLILESQFVSSNAPRLLISALGALGAEISSKNGREKAC